MRHGQRPPTACVHPKTRQQETACFSGLGHRPDTAEQSACCLQGPGPWEKQGRGGRLHPLRGGNWGRKAAHENSVHLYPTLSSSTQHGSVNSPKGCRDKNPMAPSPDGSPQKTLTKHPQDTARQLHVRVPPQTATVGEAKAMGLPPSLRSKAENEPGDGWEKAEPTKALKRYVIPQTVTPAPDSRAAQVCLDPDQEF